MIRADVLVAAAVLNAAAVVRLVVPELVDPIADSHEGLCEETSLLTWCMLGWVDL